MDEHWDRLAAQVTYDRKRLYRTVTKATAKSGVARGTWDRLERGERVKSFTLSAVEEALGWPQGRAERILAGEDETSQPLPDHIIEGIMASDVLTEKQKRELIRQLGEPDPHAPPDTSNPSGDSLQGIRKEG